MLSAADVRVFISDTVRHDLLGKTPKHASELLFNGIDRTIFHPGKGRFPEALANIDMTSATRRLLFVGRYVEKKGLAVLRALAQSRPDLMIVLAGTGPIKPSEWGLANVRDIGPQTPEALANLYHWADLLILPSVGDGLRVTSHLRCSYRPGRPRRGQVVARGLDRPFKA
jgi:glycosyltransferase involved in cell wall biosynthesis